MTTKKDDPKSSPRRNRTDLLTPEFTPHPPVQPLGLDLLHGPPLAEHIVVILGVGPGLGLAIAQVFASRGYTTAILSRSKDRLSKWADELHSTAAAFRTQHGIEVKSGERLSGAFACDAMDNSAITSAIDQVAQFWPDKTIGSACYNASVRKRGPFLEQSLDQIQQGVQGSILAGFTFAQSVLPHLTRVGGNLLVTGATSSTRGREGFAGFAASKSGLRAMCQSIAREFGPQNVHVTHVIVDGLIESETALEFLGMPKGSRFKDGTVLVPAQMAKSWLFLAQQHRSGWTFEMDLRPAREHW
ncbi:Short-chain dehydrogenase/reductase SDR [Kalmanozyma brasiliensis GHG001]|uniref:NAD(P)-binding protein n=1 Tax=Kalmanozyma brasiliensis (strain GHG001) TaxID=1365824 RepID=V5EEK9_KALBG|nr:Short-chain dehydrogenase/reductase SDR [Kalmanozyma brasiliensis GHG001]EST08936.1 Short-chain dehydrogenase/reductase SDR [Kalmanozyma brasiliensis GHG001]